MGDLCLLLFFPLRKSLKILVFSKVGPRVIEKIKQKSELRKNRMIEMG